MAQPKSLAVVLFGRSYVTAVRRVTRLAEQAVTIKPMGCRKGRTARKLGKRLAGLVLVGGLALITARPARASLPGPGAMPAQSSAAASTLMGWCQVASGGDLDWMAPELGLSGAIEQECDERIVRLGHWWGLGH